LPVPKLTEPKQKVVILSEADLLLHLPLQLHLPLRLHLHLPLQLRLHAVFVVGPFVCHPAGICGCGWRCSCGCLFYVVILERSEGPLYSSLPLPVLSSPTKTHVILSEVAHGTS
jgi:hypothetical protein